MTEDKILEVLEKMLGLMHKADKRMESVMLGHFSENKIILEKTLAEEEKPPTHESPYDWWRLQNGDYAKVYKIELKGTIYKEDGTMVTNFSPIWNPYSLRCKIGDSDKVQFDLKNRKSSVEDKGWPEWTK